MIRYGRQRIDCIDENSRKGQRREDQECEAYCYGRGAEAAAKYFVWLSSHGQWSFLSLVQIRAWKFTPKARQHSSAGLK
jgi:hypothetical protein